MKNENEEEERGNDTLNGIERWMPEEGKKVPKRFKYKDSIGIWYRNKAEACAVLSRAGVPPEKWEPVTPEWPDVSGGEEEKENGDASAE